MLILSEVLIQHHEISSYVDLVKHIQYRALEGEIFFDIDVKPPYLDTPEDWEENLEIMFTSPIKITP